ncbi:MAG: hypothetical protein ACP5M1_06490 [Acidiphilium sp.]
MLFLSDIWRRPPAQRFAAIIALLREIVGAVGYRTVDPPLNIAVYKRLGFFARRFAQILAQPARPARPHSTPRPRAQRPKPAPSAVKLPTRFGWLPRLYPGHQIPGAGGQLTHLLTEPDMIALINAHPSLARILRPLCHMLRLKPPPYLALPPKTTPQKPATIHQRKPPQPTRSKPPPRPKFARRPIWGLDAPTIPPKPICKNRA